MQSLRFQEVFARPPAAAVEAPGRVNLIGEHTDYSGGWVLPAAISLATRVWLRYREDEQVRAASRERGETSAAFGDPASGSWLDYVRGVARALAETGRIPARGFELWVESDLPEGAGLSSSAALCVAVGHALATAAGAPFRRDEGPLLAVACQRAEGEFVGIPCGIMDPYVIACAHEGTALLLDCARLRAEPVPLPDDLALIVLDTGVRRALRDGRYQERVEECEAAREAAQVALDRPLGQLAELRPSDLARLEAELDPHLFRRTRHVVGENERVTRAVEALRGSDLERAGRELYASHDSLARDYEVSWLEADAVVAASRDIGAVLGARMTGAGWGGCTLHLVRSGDAEATQAALHDAFATRFGAEPRSWCMRPGPAAHGI